MTKGIYDQLARMEEGATKPAPATPKPKRDRLLSSAPKARAPRRDDAMTDVRRDAVTSWLQGVNLSDWRGRIENTETHTSTLRITAAERDRIEDLVRDLRRKHKIKTSMNELARLGLLLLEHDFRTRGEESVIHHVKGS